jgi:hypothetical protein
VGDHVGIPAAVRFVLLEAHQSCNGLFGYPSEDLCIDPESARQRLNGLSFFCSICGQRPLAGSKYWQPPNFLCPLIRRLLQFFAGREGLC